MIYYYEPRSNVNEVVDSFDGYQPMQPSLRFPWRPITPPRVDNKNQPWYGSNSRWWGEGPDDVLFNDATITQSSGQDRYTVKSVWQVLNDWFGGMDAKYNLADQSSVPGMPQDSSYMGDDS